jgi:phosphatidylglycerophosphatase A
VSRWVATVCGIGYLPIAPGTWASAAAIPFAYVFLQTGGPLLLGVAALCATLAGAWASGRYGSGTGRDDPNEVVIDEVAGQWITMLPAGLVWTDALCAFLLFRLTDILKPWPACWADRNVAGGIGVMADDVMAGIYAALALWLLKIGDLL